MRGAWLVSYVVLWALVALLTVVVVALARQIGTLHLRIGPQGALEVDDEGPALGAEVAAADATDVFGHPVRVGGPGETMRILLFATPGCRLCRQVLPALQALKKGRRADAYLITDATDAETAAAYGSAAAHATVIASIDLAQRFAVPGTPYVVVLDERGVVLAKGTVNTLEQFEGLVESGERRGRAPRTEAFA